MSSIVYVSSESEFMASVLEDLSVLVIIFIGVLLACVTLALFLLARSKYMFPRFFLKVPEIGLSAIFYSILSVKLNPIFETYCLAIVTASLIALLSVNTSTPNPPQHLLGGLASWILGF